MFDLMRRNTNFFDEFFSNDNSKITTILNTDITENDKEYTFEIDLPGFQKENIKVSVDSGYLVVSATNSYEDDIDEKNYIKRERSYGKYVRKYAINKSIDINDLKASFDNGVLKIIVPKKLDEPKVEYLTIE